MVCSSCHVLFAFGDDRTKPFCPDGDAGLLDFDDLGARLVQPRCSHNPSAARAFRDDGGLHQAPTQIRIGSFVSSLTNRRSTVNSAPYAKSSPSLL